MSVPANGNMSAAFYCTLGCKSAAECQRHRPDDCAYAYDASNMPDQYRWKGDGDPPASWTAIDGTKVYRSYSDYCD